MTYRNLNPVQQEWVDSHGTTIPDDVDDAQDFVSACEHDPEPYVMGVTQREYCPRCGKVLDETLMEYKYE